MNTRLVKGDKVEVIDDSSEHFGKKGKVTDLKTQPHSVLNNPSAPNTVLTLSIEIENTNN